MEEIKPLIITLDGPSASGKGTLAKKISDYFTIPHLNSGLIYRQLAYKALENNLNLETNISQITNLIHQIDLTSLNNTILSQESIGCAASTIAKNTKVREGLLNKQKDFINHAKENFNGCVLDGRDMGTVIYPEASHKFFITASIKKRADRRFSQHNSASYEEILANLTARDRQDKERKSSPLIAAQGAIEIDTSSLNIEQSFKKILTYINVLKKN